jgi:diamine N-acetyltransferase
MVDEKHQGKGYGKAAMLELIRRLKLHPEVEIIATSHLKTNKTAASLYKSLGFVDWDHGARRYWPRPVSFSRLAQARSSF